MLMLGLDPAQLSAEALARASVIIGVFVLLLFSSLSSIHIILHNRNLNEVTGFYMISMAFADLLWAIMIVPLSIYSSLTPGWAFTGDDSWLCKYSAYLQITVMTSTLYTFGWICVDRYTAFTKPSRYESEQTLTRCKCWITLTWATAILTACPVIVAKMEANYYHEFEFCVLNWSSATAYSVTLLVLVLVPSFCTICFTAFSIFSALKKPEELEDVQRTVIETDQNFVLTLFVMIAFVLAWLPIVLVHFIPESVIHPADTATIKFALIWLAIGGQSSKWLIYMFTNSQFRRHFCSPCLGADSDDEEDEEEEGRAGCCARLCCCCCWCCGGGGRRRKRAAHPLVANDMFDMQREPLPRVQPPPPHLQRTTSLMTSPLLASSPLMASPLANNHLGAALGYGFYHNGSPSALSGPAFQPFGHAHRQPEYGSFAQIPAGF